MGAFKPEGAFGWYAAWCLILWVLVLLFMPETKALTLEELVRFTYPTSPIFMLTLIPFVGPSLQRSNMEALQLPTQGRHVVVQEARAVSTQSGAIAPFLQGR